MIHRGRTGQIQAEHRGPRVGWDAVEVSLRYVAKPWKDRWWRHHRLSISKRCLRGRSDDDRLFGSRCCWWRQYCRARFVQRDRCHRRVQLAIVQLADFTRSAERVAVDFLSRQSIWCAWSFRRRFGCFGVKISSLQCTCAWDVAFSRGTGAFLCLKMMREYNNTLESASRALTTIKKR